MHWASEEAVQSLPHHYCHQPENKQISIFRTKEAETTFYMVIYRLPPNCNIEIFSCGDVKSNKIYLEKSHVHVS